MPRTRFRFFALALWGALALQAQAAAGAAPQFADYPAGPVYRGATAPLKLSPEARQFRTRLREAARGRPNFAGQYILVSWGCGTGCSMYGVIDAKTGVTTVLPFTVTATGPVEEGDPVQYRLDSKLVIVKGALNEAEQAGTYYYKWEANKLNPIR